MDKKKPSIPSLYWRMVQLLEVFFSRRECIFLVGHVTLRDLYLQRKCRHWIWTSHKVSKGTLSTKNVSVCVSNMLDIWYSLLNIDVPMLWMYHPLRRVCWCITCSSRMRCRRKFVDWKTACPILCSWRRRRRFQRAGVVDAVLLPGSLT